MRTPPFLLGAGLLFWSVQSGYWILAGLLAFILESARRLERRWEFAPKDFYRVGDLSTVLFASTVVYLVMTLGVIQAWALVLCWLPISLFPVIAAQELSVQGRLDLGALFWSLRGKPSAARSIDVSYPYFALCIISSGAANRRTPVYFAGMYVLCAWALWRFRPAGRSAWRWAAVVAAAGILGAGIAGGLSSLQVTLERSAINAVFGGGEVSMDPYQTRTAMGQIGKIQQSGDIALRVRAQGKPPALLRAASYNHYSNAQWFAREPGFRPVSTVQDGTGSWWELSPDASVEQAVLVTAAWPKGIGMLALPLNASRVGLLAGALVRNKLGAVKASEAPSAVTYIVGTAPGASRDAAPDAFDLEVPPADAATLKPLVKELKLGGMRPAQAVAAVSRFFADNFRYTIFQNEASAEPLKNFLFKTRAGHCEYFATSTVLLLRAAGLPARYATGYSVQEYSRLEKEYVVRQRHAHAWTLVWIDGAWRDLDTTPMSWPEIEQSRASSLEPLSDIAGWALLRFSLWRQELALSGGGGPMAWLLLTILIGWMVWKAAALARASRRAAKRGEEPPAARGTDSEFYRIEDHLGRAELGRKRWEAPAAWVERIAEGLGETKSARLRSLAALHSRYRFDPRGLSAAERASLKAGVSDWLALDGDRIRG